MEKLLPTTSLYDFNSDFDHLGFPKSELWTILLASSNICIRDISNLFVLHPQFGFIHQQLLQYIALLIPRAHRIGNRGPPFREITVIVSFLVLLLFLCLSTVDLKDWTRSVQDLIPHGGFCAIKLQDLKGSVFSQSLQVREKLWRDFFMVPSPWWHHRWEMKVTECQSYQSFLVNGTITSVDVNLVDLSSGCYPALA